MSRHRFGLGCRALHRLILALQTIRHLRMDVLVSRLHQSRRGCCAGESPSLHSRWSLTDPPCPQVTSPLVTKALINFGTQAYYAHRGVPGYSPPNVGRGVGLAIGLWLMQLVTALSVHQFFVRSAGTGVLARAALITSIYRKAMVLSGKVSGAELAHCRLC